VLASCGVKMEQTEVALRSAGEGQPALLLAEAILSAQELYGRDQTLDGFLRKARKIPVASLGEGDVRAMLEQFRTLLAALPVL